jgi:hypothetical protein
LAALAKQNWHHYHIVVAMDIVTIIMNINITVVVVGRHRRCCRRRHRHHHHHITSYMKKDQKNCPLAQLTTTS